MPEKPIPLNFQPHLPALRALRDRFRKSPPDQPEVAQLTRDWEWAAKPGDDEWLALCTLAGAPTGAFAPRWLAHLTGMPHCTAHVGLMTPSGFVVLQRRSERKAQFPDAWDLAVTGHVSLPADAPLEPISYLAAAARELEEEMGLPQTEHDDLLQPPGMVAIGAPAAYYGECEAFRRPWYDLEVRQLFGAVLTPAGLARLTYPEVEISAILLCRPAEALHVAAGPQAAAGVLGSVGELVGWWERRAR
jgi:isopentenyldiphosphate isomerase